MLAGTTVFLNDDFTDAELIDAVANRLHGLIDGLLALRLLLRRLQTHRVGVGHVARG